MADEERDEDGDLLTSPMRPRDAASLVIMDAEGGKLRILFGRRRAEQAFAPSKVVFPGGSYDDADGELALDRPLDPLEEARLLAEMRGSVTQGRARGLALAAIRETYEETGLLIGRRSASLPEPTSDGWSRFLAHGFTPAVEALTFFARAITPPGRTRRFDARFFCVPASAIALRTGHTDEEFAELLWATIEEARALNLHSMTNAVLEDLQARLDGSLRPIADAPVPFYFMKRGEWCRELISISRTPP